jgi:flagellar biogenesis protein FliO
MRIATYFLFLSLFFQPLSSEEATSTIDIEEEVVSPRPEGSPPEFSTESYQKHFTKTFTLTILAIGVLLLAAYLVRRFTHNLPLQGNQRKNIKILERRPLSQNTQLYMVQIGKDYHILAESKLEVRNIATISGLDVQ